MKVRWVHYFSDANGEVKHFTFLNQEQYAAVNALDTAYLDGNDMDIEGAKALARRVGYCSSEPRFYDENEG